MPERGLKPEAHAFQGRYVIIFSLYVCSQADGLNPAKMAHNLRPFFFNSEGFVKNFFGYLRISYLIRLTLQIYRSQIQTTKFFSVFFKKKRDRLPRRVRCVKTNKSEIESGTKVGHLFCMRKEPKQTNYGAHNYRQAAGPEQRQPKETVQPYERRKVRQNVVF